ncbi:MAG: hypothetical protein IK114_08905 [Fibrobacter sp.]|nr:hypothetical protein [Fibrobacter sp.]
MPYQKILKVTSENKYLNIYVDDGYGSRLTSYACGNSIPTIISQNQYGALVSWYDESQHSIYRYDVIMAGVCEEAIVFSGSYIPDGWQEMVKRLYFESLPQPEEGNIGNAPSQTQTNPIPQKQIGIVGSSTHSNSSSSIHLKQSLKPNLKSDLKPGQLLALCALVSGFIGFVFLWLNESSAAYYNLSFGIPYFPRIIGIIFLILSIPFIKLALKKNLGCSMAAIAILLFAVAASIYIRFFT